MDRGNRDNRNYNRGGGGGGRGGDRRDRNSNVEVTIPADLDEDLEYFLISPSDADYSFITDLQEPLHANWIHVLLCTILISSTGKSFTLDNLYAAVKKRGCGISKEDLMNVLQCDYYHKHETYVDPKIETCRFSINVGVTKPESFLIDLNNGKHPSPPKSTGLMADGAMFIISMVRNQPAADGAQRGELLFKEADMRNQRFLLIPDKPGQLYRNVNSRTTYTLYTTNKENDELEGKTKQCVAIQKRQQAKEFYYCFFPADGPGGW